VILTLLLLSPIIGSFLGVLIRRIPQRAPIALDRSRCDTCHHPLGPAELIPLLSYALQKGRCKHCHTRISPFHPAIELATTAITLSAILAEPNPTRLPYDCLLGWLLLTLAWIDWTHLRLPDVLTYPLIVLGCLEPLHPVTWPAEGWKNADWHTALWRLEAAGDGWLTLAITGWLYLKLRHRKGIGDADANLYAAAGAWLGLAGLAPTLLIAALSGLTLALLHMARTRTLALTKRYPFGPALATAIWLVRLIQPHLTPP